MEFKQAFKFIKQYQREHNLATVKDTLNALGEIAHLLALDLYVAKDIVAWGHCSQQCPTLAVGAVPANQYL